MLVRRAEPGEYEAIGAVTVAAYEPFLNDVGSDYRKHLAGAERRDAEAELWVAELDDRIVGTVTYCPLGSPWHEMASEGEGEFRMLAVHPDGQGHGVGTALVETCEERARAEGLRSMVLCSQASMAAAHRLYVRQGYTRAPERDWEPVPGVDLVAFVKELL
ncbi:MAG: GNAT family N-acetyltransferase [Nocardioides sp.]